MIAIPALTKHSSSFLQKDTNAWKKKYQDLIKELRLSSKARNFITCLSHFSDSSLTCKYNRESTEENNHQCPSNHFQHNYFCQGFCQLSKKQRQMFLITMLEYMKYLQKDENPNEMMEQMEKSFDGLLRRKVLIIPQWDEAKITLIYQLKKLFIKTQSGQLELKLWQYIVRKSKMHQFQITFECIDPISIDTEEEKVRISFTKYQKDAFSELYRDLVNITALIQANRLYKLSKMKKNTNLMFDQKRQLFVFITPMIVDKIQKYYRNALEKLNRTEENTSMIPETSIIEEITVVKTDQKMNIELISGESPLYRMSLIVSQFPRPIIINEFLAKYQQTHKMLFRTKQLETFSSKRQSNQFKVIAFYQKLILNSKIFNQLMIMHQIVQEENTDSLNLLLQNIEPSQSISFIERMEIKSRQIPHNQYQINFQVIFSKRKCFSEDNFINYLQYFREMFVSGSNVSSNPEGKFLTRDLLSIYKNQSNEEEINAFLTSRSIQNPEINLRSRNFNPEELPFDNIYSCLIHKFQMEPSADKCGKLVKEHFLWSFWKRMEDGGLMCSDQQLVQRQKKMARVVLSKFGETILKGKNVINFSLPVVVFKKESHLESIAKTYLYSPVFVEKSVSNSNPIERIKSAICMMMTENALSIHMEKPFNPILGETYQGFIDGCPIYLEQISHHPPISAYYLVGRGFKKYGTIEPQISFSINKASGFSSNPHYIEYDDGMKIEYILAQIAIGGLLVGERTFKFQGKMYAYDRKNRYFASMKFGPIQDGFFSSSPEPQDYFHGFIYQVTPEFQFFFDKSSSKLYPEEKHIIRRVASFDGIWNSYVRMNNEEVVNFMTDLPYIFEYQNHPIPSDSRYREDRRELIKGDLEKAQEEKQKMEQIQRNDRKLRRQMKKLEESLNN